MDSKGRDKGADEYIEKGTPSCVAGGQLLHKLDALAEKIEFHVTSIKGGAAEKGSVAQATSCIISRPRSPMRKE